MYLYKIIEAAHRVQGVTHVLVTEDILKSMEREVDRLQALRTFRPPIKEVVGLPIIVIEGKEKWMLVKRVDNG